MWKSLFAILFLASATVTIDVNRTHIADRQHDMKRAINYAIEKAGGTIHSHGFRPKTILADITRFTLPLCNKDHFILPLKMGLNTIALNDRVREAYGKRLVEKQNYLGQYVGADMRISLNFRRVWQQLVQNFSTSKMVKLDTSLVMLVPPECETDRSIDWTTVWIPKEALAQ